MVNLPNTDSHFMGRRPFTPTDEQRDILQYEGNFVIAAGPGSGKTTVLSHKIKQVLEHARIYQGVAAVSFTNKASNELFNRVQKICKDTKQSFFGTMDSFYISNIIIPFANRYLGNPPENLIITQTPERGDTRLEVLEIKAIIQAITSLIRGYEGVSLQELQEQEIPPILQLPTRHLQFLRERYERGNLDLRFVPGLANLIILSSSVCQRYIYSRYTHLIIDEFQDSGYEQYQLFMRIIEVGVTGWAVGDHNQFLYRFLDKDPTYLINLFDDRRFATFPMSENQRSHPSINHYARSLLANMEEQPVERRVFFHFVEGEERNIGMWFSENLEQIKQYFGVTENAAIGVLAKKYDTLAWFGSRLQVPFKYYQKLLIDTDQTTTGKILHRLLTLAFDKRQSIASFVEDYMGRGVFKEHRLIKHCKELIRVWKETIVSFYNEEHDDRERIEAVFREISEFLYPNADSLEQTVINLQQVLSNLRYLENFIPAKSDEVQLMTIHKSKGLEFDVVLHLDLYQYIIPSYGWIKHENIQEYRDSLNLHYVAVTRARKGVILASSSHRMGNSGQPIPADVSEFILYELVETWQQ
ncbi:hypothetical protein COI88_28705 [Bacillus cereus]|nr:hypothetical protein COI88_28705 [Bacillus cereus]